MAQTLTTFFSPVVATLGAANVATEFRFPQGTRNIWVAFIGEDGKMAYSGTDGGAIAANYVPVAKGGVEYQHAGDQRVYLATAAGGCVVSITAVDR